MDNVLTMTATGITKGRIFWDTTKPERLTKFSNYGRNSVDLAAPGQDIISTWAPASNMCEVGSSYFPYFLAAVNDLAQDPTLKS